MKLPHLSIARKSFLGVDIGTSAIKIVELSKLGDRKKLDNYGEMQSSHVYEKPFRTFDKSTLNLSDHDIVRAILAILGEAKMKTNRAYFSIPDFSTFFTNFKLPSMTEEEVPPAVQYEARRHIPLPLSEVTLDWQIIGKAIKDRKLNDFDILLVAVPNEVVRQYQEIANACRLELLALEAEVFGLARALSEKKEGVLTLIDIGARSTTINIVDGGIVKISHSFDTSGNDFTSLVARSLNIDYQAAEELKRKKGLLYQTTNELRSAIMPTTDLVVNEVKKILQNFYQTENKEPQKVILAGGSAFLPGLVDYFSKELAKPIEVANPFAPLYYPPILENNLKEMGPAYAIAVGAALRGLE